MTYTNALKKIGLISLTCMAFNLGLTRVAIAAEETATSEAAAEPSETEVEKNLGDNDEIRVSRLAELSGKTKEEILKMRTEQKMGWGAIAKSLGVPPRELGQAIRNDRKERNAQRKLEKNERKEKKLAMKERRQEKKDKKSDNKERK